MNLLNSPMAAAPGMVPKPAAKMAAKPPPGSPGARLEGGAARPEGADRRAFARALDQARASTQPAAKPADEAKPQVEKPAEAQDSSGLDPGLAPPQPVAMVLVYAAPAFDQISTQAQTASGQPAEGQSGARAARETLVTSLMGEQATLGLSQLVPGGTETATEGIPNNGEQLVPTPAMPDENVTGPAGSPLPQPPNDENPGQPPAPPAATDRLTPPPSAPPATEEAAQALRRSDFASQVSAAAEQQAPPAPGRPALPRVEAGESDPSPRAGAASEVFIAPRAGPEPNGSIAHNLEPARLAEAHHPETIAEIGRAILSLRKSGPSTLRLELQPESLGKIELQLARGAEGLRVTLNADLPGTGLLLEQHLSNLRHSLAEAGVDLASLTVGYGAAQGRTPGEASGQPGKTPGRYSAGQANTADAPERIPALRRFTSTSQVDYRV